jgi:cytidylate kinase
MGTKVAELVADRLGYECIAREVLLEASEQFNIPQAKLLRAIHDAPSIVERTIYGNREKYVTYIQAALLRHLQRDNVVYHGLAGHFFLRGVAHVLKVRILAHAEDRIRIVMERDNVQRDRAIVILKHDDTERRKWSRSLYGIDTNDPSLYDLVLRIHKFRAEDAAEIVSHAAGLEQFQTTPESRQTMDDRVLAAEVKAALVDIQSDVNVWASAGAVRVNAKTTEKRLDEARRDLEQAALKVEGVKSIEVRLELPLGSPWDV